MLKMQELIGTIFKGVEEMVAPLIARVRSLEDRPPPRDGRDGKDGVDGLCFTLEDARGTIRLALDEAIAALPPPRDGRDGTDGRSFTPEDVLCVVESVTKSVQERIVVPQDGKDGRDGVDGTSVTLEDVAPMIAEAVSKAVDESPRVQNIVNGKDGRDGVDGRTPTNEEILTLVREVMKEFPVPRDGIDGKDGKDGTSVTLEDVSPVIAAIEKQLTALFDDAVAKLPVPRDGRDGKDGTSVTLADLQPWLDDTKSSLFDALSEWVDALPVPKDGRDGKDGASVDREALVAELREDILKLFRQLPTPKDGVDGRDGVDGTSVSLDDVKDHLESLYSKWALEFTNRTMDTIQRTLDKIPLPKDGRDGTNGADGIGFDDLDVVQTGKRSCELRFTRDGVVKSFPLTFSGALFDEGVYSAAKAYARGDCVTYAGCYWTAVKDTKLRPGDGNNDWRLVAKKGRDGKDGEKGDRGERGPPGKKGDV